MTATAPFEELEKHFPQRLGDEQPYVKRLVSEVLARSGNRPKTDVVADILDLFSAFLGKFSDYGFLKELAAREPKRPCGQTIDLYLHDVTAELRRTALHWLSYHRSDFAIQFQREIDGVFDLVKQIGDSLQPGEGQQPLVTFMWVARCTADYVRDTAALLRAEGASDGTMGEAAGDGTYNEGAVRSTQGLRLDEKARLAFWGKKKLKINSHDDFGVLAALTRADGGIVEHLELATAIRPDARSRQVTELREAPPSVKEAVSHIRKALKEAGCPLQVNAVKGQGYRLRIPDE